ncbi:hypothetical protein QCA50_004313 [Cerrena zonata]|uniref:Uncharacterized protein n=1 Tax=Cerrena zonata TaxID=2478898 RepID=A0AAW0GTP3_9APHY
MATSFNPYMLSLDIPKSPLISDEELTRKMEAAGISRPLPTLSFASSSPVPTSAGNTPVKCTTITSFSSISSVPSVRDKSLPPIPRIPSKQIISLLELLERMDDDVSKEVHRVQESVKEAYEMIQEYVQARDARMNRLETRRIKQKSETKGVGDEFWLNA